MRIVSITFAAAVALAVACAPEQPRISGKAHAGANGTPLVQALGTTDPHAVQRDATVSAYCLKCHVEIDPATTHPLGVSQAQAAIDHPGEYAFPPLNPAFAMVNGEYVECSSCHDDGSAGFPFRTVAADMCAGCHDKGAADVTAPIVAITSPAEGAVVMGTITVQVSATDDRGVTSVELYATSATNPQRQIGSVVPAGADVTFAFDTTTFEDGPTMLIAQARDAAGQVGTAKVTVDVDNVPPDTTSPTVTLTAPAKGLVRGTITVAGTLTDDVGVTRAELWIQGASETAPTLAGTLVDPGTSVSYVVDTAAIADGTLAGEVRAFDAAGNVGTATLAVLVDNTPPTVAITAPTEGTTVRVTTTIAAAAADANGVAKVEFLVDGALLSTSSTAPFSADWTPVRRSGLHTLAAVATDAAGNTAASAPVAVVAK